MYYSLLGRGIEHEIIPRVRQTGLALLAWSPLAGGILSGEYARMGGGSAGDRRTALDFPPIDRARGEAVVELLRTITADHGASSTQVALAWLLAQPVLTSVIVGASTAEQLSDNLAARTLTPTRAQCTRRAGRSASGGLWH
jgi:aryl-alcohol dehydrogenase-like predicted oxidoreductase